MFVQNVNNNIVIFNNNYPSFSNNNNNYFFGANNNGYSSNYGLYNTFQQQQPQQYTSEQQGPQSVGALAQFAAGPSTVGTASPEEGSGSAADFSPLAAQLTPYNSAGLRVTTSADDTNDERYVPNCAAVDDSAPYALTFRDTKFRIDQAEFLCRTLENSENIQKLADFLSELPLDDPQKVITTTGPSVSDSSIDHKDNDSNDREDADNKDNVWRQSQQIARAKALVLFHERRFDAFYAFVASRQFAAEHHPLLQRLWNEAHYAETEMLRGKQLDPVSRYRVRKKNPYPKTIWDGEGTSYCFKKSARVILRNAYRRQRTPSQQEKRELATLTKLSVTQVSNWFKNQRQRARQYAREGRAPPSTAIYDDSSSADEDGDNDDDEDEEDCGGVSEHDTSDNGVTETRGRYEAGGTGGDGVGAKRCRLEPSPPTGSPEGSHTGGGYDNTAATAMYATMAQICGTASGVPIYGTSANVPPTTYSSLPYPLIAAASIPPTDFNQYFASTETLAAAAASDSQLSFAGGHLAPKYELL